MIYKIKESRNKLIEKAYEEGMKEFNDFFGINWIYNLPSICVLKNRKEIDLFQYKSERWVVGFTKGGNVVYVLEQKNIEKESSHKKYSSQKYFQLIKHELCHLFYQIKAGGKQYPPRWLTEGVSIYLSRQIQEKKPVEKFICFIESYKNNNDGTYLESGRSVQLLIENFGKKKMLELISKLKDTKSEKEFAQ